ncbi:hypothetical protein [Chryseolinea lacunae]|uniref:Uncharacterized protein n=1 Tax=Chryseolinea lacunae TaxID=2801331 RepID=A0ABS1KR76_9BACT|nr:hypothetical protein [Chryseolinea lacunae]MBL0741752.1 hypothetical protein [Chryseolinea lacunae]
MKVKSTVYKGIEYVQVSALPKDQMEKLLQTINRELFIKILIDDKLVSNCIQFKDYETWFDHVYGLEVIPARKTKKEKDREVESVDR